MRQLHRKHKAFTLIEVLVSVIIVTMVVMGAMELQGKNQDFATFIATRVQAELANSLFLTPKAYRYDKDEKDAYEILREEFTIEDDESRTALKKITRQINLTEDQEIPISLEENTPPIFTFYTNEVLLKGEYPARYYNFR